eukprot:TRINITY_DN4282_c0_g1_i2.p1 TRINITY_DN4282_c0_g1~~TRINITY_DN4282_c0_g1_i2.p1  ORF type:complete len:401 (-),score=107.52 TRINITY_DN4282_c0_g1_i2:595-1623(-)
MVGLPMRALAYSTAIALLLLGEAEGGLLRVGKPIPWTNALPHLNYVREHGVSQFINRYREVRDICNDELKWGDEVEYGIFKVDHGAKKVRVALRAAEVREALEAREAAHSYRAEGCAWHPEYGAWMLEGTPRAPFRGFTTDLLRVERSMRLRRARILAALAPDEIAPTVTAFPRFGAGDDFCAPPALPCPGGPVAESAYVPDAVINPHPRFAALTANIRAGAPGAGGHRAGAAGGRVRRAARERAHRRGGAPRAHRPLRLAALAVVERRRAAPGDELQQLQLHVRALRQRRRGGGVRAVHVGRVTPPPPLAAPLPEEEEVCRLAALPPSCGASRRHAQAAEA